MVEIHEVHVSWCAVRTLPTLLRGGSIPGPRLADYGTYVETVDAGREDALGKRWLLPWVPEPSYSMFWRWYLKRLNYRTADADRCWRRLVPLRESPAPTVTWAGSDDLDFDVATSRYLLPHGVAASLTLRVHDTFNPDALLAALASTATLPVVLRGGSDRRVTVPGALRDLLSELERDLLGSDDPDAPPGLAPFSVVTVTAASGPPEELEVANQKPTHQLLHGLASAATAVPQAPPPLDDHLLATRRSVYRTDRARVVWSAGAFRNPQRAAKLACYHENLLTASLLTDSFLDLADWAFDATSNGRALAPEPKAVCKSAMFVLSLLYIGVKDVWKSHSVRAQIDDSTIVPHLQEVWKRLQVGSGSPFG